MKIVEGVNWKIPGKVRQMWNSKAKLTISIYFIKICFFTVLENQEKCLVSVFTPKIKEMIWALTVQCLDSLILHSLVMISDSEKGLTIFKINAGPIIHGGYSHYT